MFKNIRVIMISIIIILAFIGIWFMFIPNRKAKYIEPQVIDGVSMVINENTLTKSGATIIITDTVKEEEHIYGSDYKIEKKEKGKWIYLKPINDYGFTDEGYYVNKDNILEMDVKWDKIYGELKSGEYRLIKRIVIHKNERFWGTKEIYTEFTIE